MACYLHEFPYQVSAFSRKVASDLEEYFTEECGEKSPIHQMIFEVLHRVKSCHLIRLQAQIKWQKLEETLCLSTYGKDVKSITEKQMVWDVTMVQNGNFVKAS